MSVNAGTAAWLAAQNDRNAFRLLLAHGPLSRSQLGKLSGMSKPTAGQMIARLERIGLIGPAGESSGARGPNATTYGVRTDSLTGVAVNIVADRIESVLVDPTDADHPVATLLVARLPGTRTGRSPATDVSAAVDAACRSAGVEREAVSLVAIGVQAAFDQASDLLSLTDTLPGWPDQGARGLIEGATGLDVVLENDVNLATMAEAAVTGADDFAYLWLGEGLGAGLTVAGALQRGTSGSAGEIGYLCVPRSAARLDPVAEDFTDLLGGPAVQALAGGSDLAEALIRLPGDPAALTALADRIALLLEVLTAVADPALVVLGGPTGVAGGNALAELVHQRHAPRRDLPVWPARAGDRPVLLGARRLLVDGIRERLEDAIAASATKEE